MFPLYFRPTTTCPRVGVWARRELQCLYAVFGGSHWCYSMSGALGALWSAGIILWAGAGAPGGTVRRAAVRKRLTGLRLR